MHRWAACVSTARRSARSAAPSATRFDAIETSNTTTSPHSHRNCGRRLSSSVAFAAIVLLQGQVDALTGKDLTRIEGFLRDARVPGLVEPLTLDVVRPLLAGLTGVEADRARRIVTRWAAADAEGLRAAAALL